MTDPDILDWQLADVLTDEHMLFILWTVKSLFCTRREDFLREYDFEPNELDALLHHLKIMGFLQEDNAELVLTEMGKTAVSYLHTTPTLMAEQKLARVSEGVQARFNLPKERIYVEQRLIEQLQQLGWHYPQERDPDTPYLTAEGRSTYHDVLLKDRLKQAIRRINAEEGKPLLTDQQVDEAIATLEQVQPPGSGLLEANKEGLRLLLEGTYVGGTLDYLIGTNRHIRFIDIEHPYNNDFFILDQFRIELLGRQTFIVPDIVLFVNGIPLVVIECKSPDLTEPIEAAVAQLHRYASQEEGTPSLFHFNVFLMVSCFYLAKACSIGASAEEYQEWKDPYPETQEQLAQDLGVNTPDHLSSQEVLVAGMLYKENLLDLLHNFILFRSEDDRVVKLLARYQQFRAVQKAIQRLQHGALKTADHDDERGGIIWHTQGSGKSLTMVFLIRKMRKTPGLGTFKIVVITDRRDLQDQLKGTITLTAERIREAQSIEQARAMLTQHDSSIYFVMIQKARGDTNSDQDDYEGPTLPVLNDSSNILLIVDEAHRSHTSTLHGNITKALPYSAKIGFTGTPHYDGHTQYHTAHLWPLYRQIHYFGGRTRRCNCTHSL
jgi:type I restriction enzyme R subunit